jgi:hypothetical protein
MSVSTLDHFQIMINVVNLRADNSEKVRSALQDSRVDTSTHPHEAVDSSLLNRDAKRIFKSFKNMFHDSETTHTTKNPGFNLGGGRSHLITAVGFYFLENNKIRKTFLPRFGFQGEICCRNDCKGWFQGHLIDLARRVREGHRALFWQKQAFCEFSVLVR